MTNVNILDGKHEVMKVHKQRINTSMYAILVTPIEITGLTTLKVSIDKGKKL